ncbi:unnamed protein product [Soboliphyme baturini]|uniref:Uncharacterized protein n=1 Tax=Soboliphyme baturini TaxID=241478 RepID=A0A183IE10_9BILA|nr:unnamed protein product [Soboliphyme baturini]
MPICLVLAGLQKHYQVFKGIELLYNDKAPLAFDVLLNLTCDGIKLGFDASFQRLKVISLPNYANSESDLGTTARRCTLLSSPSEIPDIQKINQIFGATRPGVYDSAQQVYMLKWRGLCCTLPVESKLKVGYDRDCGADSSDTLSFQPHCIHGFSSLEFPCDASPVVDKISIYDGNSPTDIRMAEIPINCYYGNCYAESVNVIRRTDRTIGLSIELKSECIQPDTYYDLYLKTFSSDVCIGDFCQEVLSAIGAPNRIFYKSEDKMKIHLPSDQRLKKSLESDYFFNYFTLGLVSTVYLYAYSCVFAYLYGTATG